MTIASTVFYLSLCVYHEARGEPDLGQRAVVHTVLNRAEKRNMTVEQVVKEPKQFSFYNQGSPPIEDMDAFVHCVENVLFVLQERVNGNRFGGIDHYFASGGPNKIRKPRWAKGMTLVEKIGNHSFYKS